ncbi:MAG: Csu type fimbrial protein [Steroidobacteraceae bacterium]
MRSWNLLVCAIALLLLGWAPASDALTCTISASDVAFGSIDPLAGTEVDVSANIQIDCSDTVFALVDPTVGVCIYLDAGDGGSDGTVYRHMRQGSEILPYNLYKDAARTNIWGSETAFPASGAQRVIVTLTGLLPSTGSLTVPVYGRVPAAVSDRPVGAYLSTFAGGARARYSVTDTIACNGVAGTQASDTFTVTGSIAETCTVEADDLAFGTQTQLDVDVDSSSQIRTSCSSGLAYSVALGTGGGGAFAARRMAHQSFPAEIVGYQLYTDALRTQIWGDGSGGTVTAGDTGIGSPQASTVHGRVPTQATPRPGDYDDTVIVTVSY